MRPFESMTRKDVLRAGALTMLAPYLAACGGEDDEESGGGGGSQRLPTVKLQGLEGGVSTAAARIIEMNRFDEKHGFKAEVIEAAADASVQVLLQGDSDVSFDGDLITAARLRNQGNRITTFYPLVLQEATLMVPGDAEYASPKDLIGKKIGVPGLDWGYITAAQIMLQRFEGIDITNDYTLQVTPEATLIRLTDRGDLDAAFLDNPLTMTAQLEFDFKAIWGPGWEVWKEKEGGSNWNITMMAKDDWLDRNMKLAKGVTAAWDDAYAWLKEDPQRIAEDPFPEALGIEGDEVVDAFVKYIGSGNFFTNTWTDADVKAGEKFVELAAEQGAVLKKAPAGAVRRLA